MRFFHSKIIFFLIISIPFFCNHILAQIPVDLSEFKKNGATIALDKQLLTVSWPAGVNRTGRITPILIMKSLCSETSNWEAEQNIQGSLRILILFSCLPSAKEP